MNVTLLQFLKFCTVGLSGVIIDFAITYLLKEVFRLNKYLSNSLGFLIAASSNYILNRVWTFKSINSDITKEYIYFLTVSFIGLLIVNTTLWIAHGKMKYNFYISKIGGILVVTFWNFFANNYFTFNIH
jgi:putative flippase GtrA